MANISQREARRLRKRVDELEHVLDRQRSAYVSEWPNGINVASCILDTIVTAKVSTSRLLGHAVVVTIRNDKEAMFYALPL